MKKIIVFSMLLLALAITAGCNDKIKSKNVALFAPSPMTVLSGHEVSFGFSCKQTGISLQAVPAGVLITKDDSCRVKFAAVNPGNSYEGSAPGKYTVVVASDKDPDKTASVVITVVPDVKVEAVKPQYDENEKDPITILRKVPDASASTQDFKISGTKVEESIGASGTTVNWRLRPHNPQLTGDRFGFVTGKTPVVYTYTPNQIGTGVVTAEITDAKAGVTTSGSISINVIPDLFINGPEKIHPISDPVVKFTVKGSVADNTIKPYDAPPEVATLYAIGTPWANAAPHDPTLDSLGISPSAYVYMAFMGAPAAVTGYTAKTDVAQLEVGEWAALNVNGFDYVVLVPEIVAVKWMLTSENSIGTIDDDGNFTPSGLANMGVGTLTAILPDKFDIKLEDEVYDGVSYNTVSVTYNIEVTLKAGGGANQRPGELTEFFIIAGGGPWSGNNGVHEPGLESMGIPGTAYVYGGFDGSYAAIPIPATIKGYEKQATSDPASLKAGEWTVVSPGGFFQYVVIVPKFETPTELEEFMPVAGGGPWSGNNGLHEPGLESMGIPGTAYVYGGFDGSYAAIPIPATIKGYEKQATSDPASLKAGEWTVVSPGGFFQYVVIVPSGRFIGE